jgi:hypothetical protein
MLSAAESDRNQLQPTLQSNTKTGAYAMPVDFVETRRHQSF